MPKTRIFILSLPRERERRLTALDQILRTGLEFELVDAIDARSTRRKLLEVPASAWPMHEAEVACYLSHLGLLQRVCDYGLDHAILLEDDFVLQAGGRLTLGNLWEHLPADADHVQLHDDQGKLYEPYRRIRECGDFNRVSPTNVGCWGYVVSRRLAGHVLARHSVPRMPIDHLYIELSRSADGFVFYDTNQKLVSCRDGISSTIDRNQPAPRARETFAGWWRKQWIRH